MNIKILILLAILLIMSTETQASVPVEFPHLLHMNGDDAVNIIKKNHPHIKVVKLHQSSMVTMDYREDRIRIFVDDNGNVSRPPRIG